MIFSRSTDMQKLNANNLARRYIKIVEENKLFFNNYSIICYEVANNETKKMECKNVKNLENGNKSRSIHR